MPGPVSLAHPELDTNDQRGTKSGRDPRPTGKPGRGEHNEHGQGDHALGRAIVQTAGPPQDPDERRSDGKAQHQRPANTAEQGPERRQPIAIIDQRHAQRKQDPARHVVADTGRQHSHADIAAEEVQFAENSAEHGERGDGEGGADEEAKDAEADGGLGDTCVELVVDTVGNGKAQSKREDHAGQANTQRGLPILREET